ncbi:hypothetical protein [Paracraurococcus lichenis]|uniref:Uncharacterized protein n=1 Tax=Paracraurococcus lichenis TaxID=3064888 RepID=A0ABT9EC99_9PROT|nr:hypothetical protein [Paracraurococcus sp. LOR1-02]MDO9713841.1 hypothetical protein [Paracraurococcus sp. LOR1-02]
MSIDDASQPPGRRDPDGQPDAGAAQRAGCNTPSVKLSAVPADTVTRPPEISGPAPRDGTRSGNPFAHHWHSFS